MDFVENKHSQSFDEFYKNLCKDSNVKPKTKEELEQEKVQEQNERLRAKQSIQERKQYECRVVNKSSNGVTIRTKQGVQQIVSWDEFRKNWEYSDDKKFHCIPSEQALKDFKEADSLIVDLAILMLRARVLRKTGENNTELAALAMCIGDKTEKIQKLLNCSINEVREMLDVKLASVNAL